jgi:hypothetical protein
VVVVVVVEHWDWDGKIEIQMVTPQRERFNEPNNKIITVFVCVIDLLVLAAQLTSVLILGPKVLVFD